MTALFSGSTLSARIPVDEVFRREQISAKEKLMKKDLTCIEDDALLSFQEYSDDAIPFCSTFLSIPQQTAASTVYTKTSVSQLATRSRFTKLFSSTIVALTTTTVSASLVATVASGTITVTITQAPVLSVFKRQDPQDPQVPLALDLISSCQLTGPPLSLINTASSACSCLRISETTITIPTTTTSV